MKRLLPLVLAAVLLAGCSSPQVISVSPRREAAGRGDNPPELVEGVYFFKHGRPPQPYTVIGYIDPPYDNVYLEKDQMEELASVIKSAGGRAGVVVRSNDTFPGMRRPVDEDGEYVMRVQVIR